MYRPWNNPLFPLCAAFVVAESLQPAFLDARESAGLFFHPLLQITLRIFLFPHTPEKLRANFPQTGAARLQWGLLSIYGE